MEKALKAKVLYPANDGTYTIFENITERPKDVLEVYQYVMKSLWKLEKKGEIKLEVKEDNGKRPNNTKSTTKARAKKSSRNKKV